MYDLIFLKAACIIMHTSRCRCVTGYLEEKQLNFHHHDEHSEDKALTWVLYSIIYLFLKVSVIENKI